MTEQRARAPCSAIEGESVRKLLDIAEDVLDIFDDEDGQAGRKMAPARYENLTKRPSTGPRDPAADAGYLPDESAGTRRVIS